jgi:hypothetical protein
MRRLVLSVLLLLSMAPAAVAKPAPPTVAGLTAVLTQGSGAVDVTVPKGARLAVPVPSGGRTYGFASFFETGSWSAVALISRTHKVAGTPVNVMQVHTGAPDHCPSAAAPTPTPPPKCGTPVVEHLTAHGVTPTTDGKYNYYALPTGPYQLVISGPPREWVGAQMFFVGLRGQRFVFADKPVATAFGRMRDEDLAFASVAGWFSPKLTANGIGVLGLWHTTATGEPGEFSYTECLTPGSAGPVDPDTCVPLGMTGAAPPDGLGAKPLFWAGSAGGVTLDGSGNGTWQTPVLKKGTYTNSYRVTRGGRGPAAGVFVWWLQADSLR